MNRAILLIFTLFFTGNIYAQELTVECSVLDSITNEPVYGAKVFLKSTSKGVLTDEKGSCTLNALKIGDIIVVRATTFNSKEIVFAGESKLIVYLSLEGQLEEEVIVESTRANKTIKDLPTRTEVLTDEIDEAASMEPGKIAHLITHSTGIQVQTTSAGSNGAVVRIQGLNGRYTQMLKDGFPMFGGFSGSLDILQIPPLDLRQVEYIKGSASTLYGGGSIAGLVNLISKTPGKPETLLHFNASHIGARDINAFVSNRDKNVGVTALASFHQQVAYDADADGFSDLPSVLKFNMNPKIFLYPSEKTELYLGLLTSSEERSGGDTDLIDDKEIDSMHYYLDHQKSMRVGTQFQWVQKFSEQANFKVKNSISYYDRSIKINDYIGAKPSTFAGRSLNSYTDISYFLRTKNQYLTLGLNFYSNDFQERDRDTLINTTPRDQQTLTGGFYANHLWNISEKLSTETGFRFDYVKAKSFYGETDGESFLLPRISLLYKATKSISLRTGGGFGYRMPTIFNEESEPYAFSGILPIHYQEVKAERSIGGNFDVKYEKSIGENVLLTLNQMFYYNHIINPIQLAPIGFYPMAYVNDGDNVNSKGFESQIKLTVWKFTWFLGYTYTDAGLVDDGSYFNLILTPKHSIKGDILFVDEGKWRIGWDYEYKSSQLLSNGNETRSLFTTGIVVERTIRQFVLFVNAENFTDTRQTKYESIVGGPFDTPQYTEIWAPLDGFFFNLGLKLKFN